jgi:hypothetical protein
MNTKIFNLDARRPQPSVSSADDPLAKANQRQIDLIGWEQNGAEGGRVLHAALWLNEHGIPVRFEAKDHRVGGVDMTVTWGASPSLTTVTATVSGRGAITFTTIAANDWPPADLGTLTVKVTLELIGQIEFKKSPPGLPPSLR